MEESNTRTKEAGGKILTEEDHIFFKEHGYLVIHNAVPQENLTRTIDAIFDFLKMDKK